MKKAFRLILCLAIVVFAPVVHNALSSALPALQRLQLDFLTLLGYSCFVTACIIWAFCHAQD